MRNQQVIFNSVPTGYPVLNETLKLVEKEIDIDTVQLGGGFLSKIVALSLDPYMR